MAETVINPAPAIWLLHFDGLGGDSTVVFSALDFGHNLAGLWLGWIGGPIRPIFKGRGSLLVA
jgi:hypothetical protein